MYEVEAQAIQLVKLAMSTIDKATASSELSVENALAFERWLGNYFACRIKGYEYYISKGKPDLTIPTWQVVNGFIVDDGYIEDKIYTVDGEAEVNAWHTRSMGPVTAYDIAEFIDADGVVIDYIPDTTSNKNKVVAQFEDNSICKSISTTKNKMGS